MDLTSMHKKVELKVSVKGRRFIIRPIKSRTVCLFCWCRQHQVFVCFSLSQLCLFQLRRWQKVNTRKWILSALFTFSSSVGFFLLLLLFFSDGYKLKFLIKNTLRVREVCFSLCSFPLCSSWVHIFKAGCRFLFSLPLKSE